MDIPELRQPDGRNVVDLADWPQSQKNGSVSAKKYLLSGERGVEYVVILIEVLCPAILS